MKKHNALEIIALREKGYSIRRIMKELSISSPSVVQHHLKYVDRMTRLFVLPERHPMEGDKYGELICSGFNEYRKIILERISHSRPVTGGGE